MNKNINLVINLKVKTVRSRLNQQYIISFITIRAYVQNKFDIYIMTRYTLRLLCFIQNEKNCCQEREET